MAPDPEPTPPSSPAPSPSAPRNPSLPPGAAGGVLLWAFSAQLLCALGVVGALVLYAQPAHRFRPLTYGVLAGHAIAQLGTLSWIAAATWTYARSLQAFVLSTLGLTVPRMGLQLCLIVAVALSERFDLGALALSFVFSTVLGHVVEARSMLALRNAACTLAPPLDSLQPIPYEEGPS